MLDADGPEGLSHLCGMVAFVLAGADGRFIAGRDAFGIAPLTEHHERVYSPDELIDWVPEVIGVIESFHPHLVHSSVPNLLVSKLAGRARLGPAGPVEAHQRRAPREVALAHGVRGLAAPRPAVAAQGAVRRGSGARDVLPEHFGATVTDEEFQRDRSLLDPPLRTREELASYRLFQQHFEGLQPEGIVGRFVDA